MLHMMCTKTLDQFLSCTVRYHSHAFNCNNCNNLVVGFLNLSLIVCAPYDVSDVRVVQLMYRLLQQFTTTIVLIW